MKNPVSALFVSAHCQSATQASGHEVGGVGSGPLDSFSGNFMEAVGEL